MNKTLKSVLCLTVALMVHVLVEECWVALEVCVWFVWSSWPLWFCAPRLRIFVSVPVRGVYVVSSTLIYIALVYISILALAAYTGINEKRRRRSL